MSKPGLPRGTRDFGPEQMSKRNFIIVKVREIFEKYGFQPLETPSMENLSVLTGKYGDEGDQLLFKILNSGDYLSKTDINDYNAGSSSLLSKISNKGLRYDLTVPFARYVVMHQHELAFPFKRYQIQPVWRADNPQRGRYREFYQCDADIIGTDSLLPDLEIVWLIHDVFQSLGLKDFVVKINHRKILSAMSEYIGEPGKESQLSVAIDKLSKIGEQGVLDELKINNFNESALNKLQDLLKISGSNSDILEIIRDQLGQYDAGKEGIEEIEYILEKVNKKSDVEFKIELDINLARGLSYYTGMIFEVVPLGVKMGSITGGGRYDDLTGVFGLNGMSGTGISFGIDRIYDVMEEKGLFPAEMLHSSRVMVTNFDEETLDFSLGVLNQLRSAGIESEIFHTNAKMKKQFAYANKKASPSLL